jgi:Ni/Co efflux regulator RcnB
MAMRTILIAALLAGVATPALAARPDNDKDSPRRERSEARESAPRQERSAARPQRSVERMSERGGGNFVKSGGDRARKVEHPTVHINPVRSDDDGNTVREWRKHDQAVETSGNVRRRNFEPKVVEPSNDSVDVVSAGQGDTVRNWRSRERRNADGPTSIEERNMRRAPTGGGLVETKRSTPRVFERAERRISRRPIFGTEPPAPRTATAIVAKPARHWRTDWRHDRRYDWRDWRKRNRTHFHFGFYSDPFGWDYMRYGIGWRLWPSYYRNSFWLNDSWQYRLPPAYGPYRWIRYYNDALLVNIYTGEVVDVEYDVFW